MLAPHPGTYLLNPFEMDESDLSAPSQEKLKLVERNPSLFNEILPNLQKNHAKSLTDLNRMFREAK